MRAGDLRHRVDLQAVARTIDPATGARVEVWQTVRTSDEPGLIPAAIVPLSGREFTAAQATQAGVTTRITVRWRDRLQPAMRVVHEGVAYNIRAVLPDPTLRRHVNLMCESGVNDG